jgi:hypothetical protein
VAPELQIATEFQNTLIANYFYTQAASRNSRSGVTNPDNVVIDIEAEIPLAPYPNVLVATVGETLLAGAMSSTLRQQAETQVARVSPGNAPQRVAEAIWLVASSPEFALQR